MVTKSDALESEQKTIEHIPLVVTHHSKLSNLHNTLYCHLPFLYVSNTVMKTVAQPLLILYCHPKKLTRSLDQGDVETATRTTPREQQVLSNSV